MADPIPFPDNATWFGPLDPLQPVAPPGIAGRRLDYLPGANLLVDARGDGSVPARVLRALADDCDLVRLAIETRKDQLAALDWVIQPRAGMASDPADVALATSLFRSPTPDFGWDEWVRALIEDMLVLDAATLYPRRSLGGRVVALEPIDGGTIKRVIDDWGRTPIPPQPAYQQVLKGLPATGYTAEELVYLPRNPRTHRLYGLGPVEQVLLTVNMALRRQVHKLEYYTEGSQPDAFFGVPPDWTVEQLKAYQEYWDGLLAGNTAERRRIKFIHGDVKFVQTKPAILTDAFDEWLARVVCYAFSVSPGPFVREQNRATAETQDRAALREGLAPLMRWLKRLVDRVLGQVLGLPGLELAWQDTTEQDPGTLAQIAVALVGAGIQTRNEARATLGLPPLPGGDTLASATPINPVTPEVMAKANGDDWQPDEHPRQPEGAPDSIGGQFAPKSGAEVGGNPNLMVPTAATLAAPAPASPPKWSTSEIVHGATAGALQAALGKPVADAVAEGARRVGQFLATPIGPRLSFDLALPSIPLYAPPQTADDPYTQKELRIGQPFHFEVQPTIGDALSIATLPLVGPEEAEVAGIEAAATEAGPTIDATADATTDAGPAAEGEPSPHAPESEGDPEPPAPDDDGPSTAWEKGWGERGRQIEMARGNCLAPNFPVIDCFTPDGDALSIKSLDLNAQTYQNAGALESRINSYVDKLSNFQGRSWGEKDVQAEDIKSKTLDLVIPKGSGTPEQLAAISRAVARAKALGIDVLVTPF